jgi:hypothetical protein
MKFPKRQNASLNQPQAIEIQKNNGIRSSASQIRENYFLRNDGAKIFIDANFGSDIPGNRQK